MDTNIHTDTNDRDIVLFPAIIFEPLIPHFPPSFSRVKVTCHNFRDEQQRHTQYSISRPIILTSYFREQGSINTTN